MSNLLFNVANLILGKSTLLAPGTEGESEKFNGIVNPIVDALHAVLLPLMIVVLTAGVIYAVVLGVKMAKAEDAGARDEAKKRVINVVIAIGVTVALIFVLELVVSYLRKNPDIFMPKEDGEGTVRFLLGRF